MKYKQLVKAIDSTSQQLLGRAAAAVNQALVVRNWLVGAYIVEFEQKGEDRANYGTRLLSRLGEDLRARNLRGLSVQMLERTRQFYLVYPQLGSRISAPVVRKLGLWLPSETKTKKSSPVVRKSPGALVLEPDLLLRFSWTQIIDLIRIDDPLKRAFYENECLKGNWSKRQLQRQIGSLLYERTGLSSNKPAVVKRAHRQEARQVIEELIRDPYMLELGTGFCFEARQFRVTVGNDHDFLDLVFYHRLLRCHVLLDLKVRAFRHADAGQMNYYVNYFKERVMAPGDSPPVGIILCSDRDSTKVEFATSGMDNKLFVSRYLVRLPTAEQLSRFVEADRARFEERMKDE